MGKKVTTRRSISVKGLTYQRIKKYCDARGLSVSGWIEDLIEAKMLEEGIPKEFVLAPKNPQKSIPEEIISQHFTF